MDCSTCANFNQCHTGDIQRLKELNCPNINLYINAYENKDTMEKINKLCDTCLYRGLCGNYCVAVKKVIHNI